MYVWKFPNKTIIIIFIREKYYTYICVRVSVLLSHQAYYSNFDLSIFCDDTRRIYKKRTPESCKNILTNHPEANKYNLIDKNATINHRLTINYANLIK